MLSYGQPIAQAPHSRQLSKLTTISRFGSSHAKTLAGQKWVQYLPPHSAQTAWPAISMNGTWLATRGATVTRAMVVRPRRLA